MRNDSNHRRRRLNRHTVDPRKAASAIAMAQSHLITASWGR